MRIDTHACDVMLVISCAHVRTHCHPAFLYSNSSLRFSVDFNLYDIKTYPESHLNRNLGSPAISRVMRYFIHRETLFCSPRFLSRSKEKDISCVSHCISIDFEYFKCCNELRLTRYALSIHYNVEETNNFQINGNELKGSHKPLRDSPHLSVVAVSLSDDKRIMA
ncbi:hypothetical protein LOAG_13302 [Loa loa]|uniref:Uncharacterized protein n=1 Tax=Loa loa TaxID=7209 RepID=A0A1S0TJM3_LOALO|nr:hypothetical protein LOAG_13302 [Loa loa]EFO15212.1 hypothetical protein LOAG_13302 [Loa loa]